LKTPSGAGHDAAGQHAQIDRNTRRSRLNTTQDGIRLGQIGDLFQALIAQPMADLGESAPFGIGEAQGAFEVRLHNSVFFHQVFAKEGQRIYPGLIATQVCYSKTMASVTSSFRMSKDLQRELSDAAERTGKRKNAIIIEALVKYLQAMERASLAEEAQRQSELVSRNEHDADWYGLADTSGWR
jgi:predicted DNA-binding protein